MDKQKNDNLKNVSKKSEPNVINTGLLVQCHLKITDAKSGEILLKKRA